MENFNIIFVTDNEDGRKLSQHIDKLGIRVILYDNLDSLVDCLDQKRKFLIIVDIKEKDLDHLLSDIFSFSEINDIMKYVIFDNDFIDRKKLKIDEIVNIELIPRPIEGRGFSLLIEKTLLVEKYREMMADISAESRTRAEKFELLMDFSEDKANNRINSREILGNILDFEKKLMNEQNLLNEFIKRIAVLRNMEFLEMKDRINAEEMLDHLRRQELIDANRVIDAQESLINYSSKELHEAQKIIFASENVAELSRAEALKLHEEMDALRTRNAELLDIVEKLSNENHLSNKVDEMKNL